MKSNPCLLFDLDGTLLDSRDAVIDAVYYTAEKYVPGMFSRAELVKRFGESFNDFLGMIEHLVKGEFTKEHILGSYFDYIEAHHDQNVRLFPGVKEGLGRLKSSGYRLAIVTNKQKKYAIRGLELAGILHVFDTILTLDDVKQGKPSPEMLNRAMKEVGSLPQTSLMIGDSLYDLQAAQHAGVKCAILDWYGSDSGLESAADFRFSSFQALVTDLLAVKLIG